MSDLGRLRVVDRAEQVALADVRPGRAADVDLPAAALDGHDADVLDVGLRAVARAAGDRELHLGRATPCPASGSRSRCPSLVESPTPNRQNSCPTQVFTVRKDLPYAYPRGHAEVGPDPRQVLLPDAEQVDPLAAGQLDHRHVVLLGHVGDPAQLLGGGDPAAHLRHDREGAVLLDVGVHPVVDEPGVLLVDVRPRPTSSSAARPGPSWTWRPRHRRARARRRPRRPSAGRSSRIAAISVGLSIGMPGT